ncbi:hypothetical protein [Microbacterium oleivorans]|uniref:Uncharacterized protein n=1 Tax=Microbacterium oleivorans TaxID=273677 RepID=A0A7D5J0A8_9MICO|nr:hypothetical protein [Microbacterium oleivorans]QLD12595.1 hypothetical protein HW566_12930 [Microbacterium oleivorans]
MRWQRFFEDLEHQLDSEWEAERAALQTEAERLRLSRLALQERLGALADDGAAVTVEFSAARILRGRATGAGADWVSLDLDLGLDTRRHGSAALVPTGAIEAVAAPEPDLLRSARPRAPRPPSTERMTFGFVLRDLVRRRTAVRVHTDSGREWVGTIDRAGADHLDLSLHDPGAPRRAEAVVGQRVVALRAVSWVQLGSAG